MRTVWRAVTGALAHRCGDRVGIHDWVSRKPVGAPSIRGSPISGSEGQLLMVVFGIFRMKSGKLVTNVKKFEVVLCYYFVVA